MNSEVSRKIEQYESALEAHGYFVGMIPISGSEEIFAETLALAFKKVEGIIAYNAKKYGFRGLSKKAIAALHADLPSPTWGVDIAV